MQLPKFTLPASDGKTYSDKDFQTKKAVIYLYPKDATPGCTLEANDFQNAYTAFKTADFEVFGLSKDSVSSHENFCSKEGLKFPLLADEEGTLINGLGSWIEKTLMGKTYMSTDRSTFIIVNGKIVKEWRSVKPAGHAEEVLNFCKDY
jgi:peroxiredoxin Q/BCP